MKHLNLQVTPGTSEDVPSAQLLVDGARQWLRDRSIDQWQDAIPDSTIRGNAERGELFVIRRDEDLLAMVTVLDSDEETWGEQTSLALYVHRLAVARDSRGGGVGQELLKWVMDRAAEQGQEFVRLDCAADNPGLRSFYERQGFTFVRDVTVPAPTGSRLLKSSLYEYLVPSRQIS